MRPLNHKILEKLLGNMKGTKVKFQVQTQENISTAEANMFELLTILSRSEVSIRC